MASEIKVIMDTNGHLECRNIPDALPSGFGVVAARWQDGERVEAFAFNDRLAETLARWSGMDPMAEIAIGTAGQAGLREFVAHNWGDELAKQAV